MVDSAPNFDPIMDHSTTFSLNGSIIQWRENLRSNAAIRSEDADELESHLHDTMAALSGKGLSDEEAFLVATHRIGQPTALAEEFDYARPATAWRERTAWIILGALLFSTAAKLAQTGSVL